MKCHEGTEFKCRDTGSCIPIAARCDGHENCKDGSDELHCSMQYDAVLLVSSIIHVHTLNHVMHLCSLSSPPLTSVF